MNLSQAESSLGIKLPDRHRNVLLDPADPIHDACNFLVPDSPHPLLCWVDVNELLHATDRWNCWPTFLIAFASNGCGDYFAYDTRSKPPKIIYIDPDYTVDENLKKTDGFEFASFDAWYDMKMERRRTSGNQRVLQTHDRFALSRNAKRIRDRQSEFTDGSHRGRSR